MSWDNRVMDIRTGDTVRHSRTLLQSTGAYTGDFPRAKATVTSIKDLGDLQVRSKGVDTTTVNRWKYGMRQSRRIHLNRPGRST
jgi:hypothetical protein